MIAGGRVDRAPALVTLRLPLDRYHFAMESISQRNLQATLTSLEAAAASARAGFACMFSTSDEYELALISARRAEGRYDRTHSRLPISMFVGCALLVAAVALLLS